MVFKSIKIESAIRGYHVYRKVWDPSEEEFLECLHEPGNMFDLFAIKTCQGAERRIVGHLPMEISRPTKFLLDRGAIIKSKLTGKKYQRSPLVQGGLEIPCSLIIEMLDTVTNNRLTEKYVELVNDLYKEPIEPAIVGTFTKESPAGKPTLKGEKRVAKKNLSSSKSLDIRKFFRDASKQACAKRPSADVAATDAIINID